MSGLFCKCPLCGFTNELERYDVENVNVSDKKTAVTILCDSCETHYSIIVTLNVSLEAEDL